MLKEDKLNNYVIDLSTAKNGQINESFLAMFGWWTKFLLRKMLGDDVLAPVSLKGSKTDVYSFYKALTTEKDYILKYKNYGLNDPRTLKDKARLKSAVDKFERNTKLKGPFKKEFYAMAKKGDSKEIQRAIVRTKELEVETRNLINTREDLAKAEQVAAELIERNAQMVTAGLERQLTAMEKTALLLEESKKAAIAKRDAIKENIRLAQKEMGQLEILLKNTKDLNKADKKRLQEQEAALASLIETYEAVADEINDLAITTEMASDAQSRFVDTTNGLTEGLMGALGISTKFEETMLGKFDQLQADGVGFGEMLSGVTEKLKVMNFGSAFSVSILTKFAEASAAATVAMDNAQTSFNAATGAAGKFDAQIRRTERSMVRFGVGAEDAANATKSLITDFKAYTELSQGSADQARALAASLAEIGVESDTTANLLNVYTKALGLGFDEADGRIRQAVSAAEAMDIPLNKFMSDMNSFLPQLSMFGSRADEVFKDMQAVVKSTGVEMDKLMGLFEQWDTFEGAATAAGKLNSVLGGLYINTLDLVHAEPAEKFRLMKEALDASGKSWDAMGRRERMAVATAAGINDMATASQLFGGSLGGYEEYARKAEAAAKTQEDLAKAARDVQPLMAKLAQTMANLAVIFGPIIVALKKLLDLINYLVSGFKEFASIINEGLGNVGSYVFAIGLLTAAVWGLNAGFFATAGKARLFATVMLLLASYILEPMFSPPLYIGMFILAGGIKAVGMASNVSSAGVAVLGKAMMQVGIAVSLIIGSIALLAFAMESMTTGQIVGLIGVLGLLSAAIAAMAVAGVAAGPGLLAMGAGLMAVAVPLAIILGSIALVIAAVALLVGAFSLLTENVVRLITSMIDGGEKTLLFAAALGTIMIAALPAAAGLIAVAAGFGVLGLGMLLISTDKMNAIGRAFESFENLKGASTHLKGLASALREVAGAASEIDLSAMMGVYTLTATVERLGDEDLEGIESTARGLTSFLTATTLVPPDAPETMEKLVTQAVRFKEKAVMEREKESTVSLVTLLEKVTEVSAEATRSQSAADQNTGPVTIKLVLNEREFAAATVNSLNKVNRLKMRG